MRRSFRLEPRLEIDVDACPLARVEPSRDVEAEQPIEERRADADSAQRATGIAPVAPASRPPEIAEHHRANAGEAAPELRPRHPERVAHGAWTVRRRALTTHRL